MLSWCLIRSVIVITRIWENLNEVRVVDSARVNLPENDLRKVFQERKMLRRKVSGSVSQRDHVVVWTELKKIYLFYLGPLLNSKKKFNVFVLQPCPSVIKPMLIWKLSPTNLTQTDSSKQIRMKFENWFLRNVKLNKVKQHLINVSFSPESQRVQYWCYL